MKNEQIKWFLLFLTFFSFILITCNNSFMQDVLPGPLSGPAVILGDNRIGQTLILDTSSVSGGSGTFAYQWLTDDVNISQATGTSYTIKGSDAGKIITCNISRGASPDRITVTGKKVPYTIVLETLYAENGDSVTVSPDTGDAGDEIILHYFVEDIVTFNHLVFGGVNVSIENASAAGDGARNYTINAEDALDGIITITAVFEKTKVSGAAVTKPTVIGIPAPNSIAVQDAAFIENPGSQIAEYAISQTYNAQAESLSWQTSTSFSGLYTATTYYVYARSVENANYLAGFYSISDPIRFYTVSFHANGATGGMIPEIRTAFQDELIILPAKGNLVKTGFAFGCWNTQPGGNGENFIPGHPYQVTGNQILYAKWVAEQMHIFPFMQPENNAPVVSGITISQTGTGNYPTTGILGLNNSGDYTLIEWFYGSTKLGEGADLELNAADIRYNVAGTHNITVVVWQDIIPYSLRISFIIVQ